MASQSQSFAPKYLKQFPHNLWRLQCHTVPYNSNFIKRTDKTNSRFLRTAVNPQNIKKSMKVQSIIFLASEAARPPRVAGLETDTRTSPRPVFRSCDLDFLPRNFSVIYSFRIPFNVFNSDLLEADQPEDDPCKFVGSSAGNSRRAISSPSMGRQIPPENLNI